MASDPIEKLESASVMQEESVWDEEPSSPVFNQINKVIGIQRKHPAHQKPIMVPIKTEMQNYFSFDTELKISSGKLEIRQQDLRARSPTKSMYIEK